MVDVWCVLLILSLALSIGGLVPLLETEPTASDGELKSCANAPRSPALPWIAPPSPRGR